MADEQIPVAPAAEPAAPVDDGAAGLAHTQRVVEKFGGDPAAVVTEPASAPAPARRAPPVAAPASADPTQPRPSAKDIDQRFHERVSARKRAESAERQLDALIGALEVAGVGKKQLPSEEDDPEPNADTDWKAWMQWENRRQLRPVVEYVKAQKEREAATAKETEQGEQQRRVLAQKAEIMAEAESEYRATAEGDGYNQRFEAYSRRLFDRFLAAGHDEQEAARQTFFEIDRLAGVGLSRGQNPAVYVDAVMRYELGAGAPAQAARPAARPSPELAAHRAAAASGVAGSLSTGGAAPTASVTSGRVRGANTVAKLKGALDGMPATAGNWRKRLYTTQGR